MVLRSPSLGNALTTPNITLLTAQLTDPDVSESLLRPILQTAQSYESGQDLNWGMVQTLVASTSGLVNGSSEVLADVWAWNFARQALAYSMGLYDDATTMSIRERKVVQTTFVPIVPLIIFIVVIYLYCLFILIIVAMAYITVSPSITYLCGGKSVSATRLALMRLTDSHMLIYQLLGSDKNKSTEGSALKMWGPRD
ncbi:hypothetical protein YB2330_003568 [Saitoella coloradoensis]